MLEQYDPGKEPFPNITYPNLSVMPFGYFKAYLGFCFKGNSLFDILLLIDSESFGFQFWKWIDYLPFMFHSFLCSFNYQAIGQLTNTSNARGTELGYKI